jgi:PadR family transcriptional regulator, regulatory protein AphA
MPKPTQTADDARADRRPAPASATEPLSTTSYAILGMLALRPWSAYELTRQMRRSLDYCWPKAESVLYGEPKRLVRLGLASATREPAGRRSRTVYQITDEGRRLLGEWLGTRPGPPRFELEVMLRLLYADRGGAKELIDAVAATREWALGHAPEALEQLRGYLDDGGPFPERLHLITLFARFYVPLFELLVRWSDEADAEVASWPRTAGLGATDATRDQLRDLVARLEALAPRAGEGHSPAER